MAVHASACQCMAVQHPCAAPGQAASNAAAQRPSLTSAEGLQAHRLALAVLQPLPAGHVPAAAHARQAQLPRAAHAAAADAVAAAAAVERRAQGRLVVWRVVHKPAATAIAATTATAVASSSTQVHGGEGRGVGHGRPARAGQVGGQMSVELHAAVLIRGGKVLRKKPGNAGLQQQASGREQSAERAPDSHGG